jgi:hypothetical protein
MKKIFKEWKWVILGLLIIILIGFGIRIYNLTSLPIFCDEAIYIRWAQVMRSESTLRFLPLSDGKQPLFMWIMIPFLKIFSNPLIAGRIVSVFSGIGTLVGIFALSHLLFKSFKVSLISSFIYAIFPFSIFYDRMALADSMLSFFGVWILFFSILTVKLKRLDIAMITGFILGGAWLTKSPALYFSLMVPISLIFVKSKKELLKSSLLLIPIYLIDFGMYNILRLGPNFQMIAIRNLDYVYPISHILTSFFDPLKPFLDRIRQFYIIYGGWAIFIAWLLSYITNWKKHFKEIFILTVWILLPIFISAEFSKTMTARYVYFTLPYFIILVSSLFLNKNKILSKLAILLFVIFIFHSIWFDFKLLVRPEKANLPRGERAEYLEGWTAGQGISEITKYLKNEVVNNPDSKIVVGTEGYFGTLPDGLQINFEKNPNVLVIGIGLELNKVPTQLIESKKFGNLTYLVANNERMNANYKDLNLKLIATYPKAIRPDGSYQSLMLFEITNETISKL